MTVRETIAARRAQRFVAVELPGLGAIQVRRLTAREMISLPAENTGTALVLAAALDEERKPLYASVQEIEQEDGGIFGAIARACNEANSLSLVEAAKK